MNCMKCGRETQGQEVFCEECLQKMAACPVKPGTPVTIPKRPKKVTVSPSKKQKTEEIIEKLQKKIKILQISVILLCVLLLGSLVFSGWHFATTDHSGHDIGQNYSTEIPGGNP